MENFLDFKLGVEEQNSRETKNSCETREVAYTCRYTRGHLVPILQSSHVH